ncbi:unnamed protein product [Choristocarpus tenellus]
MQLADMGLLEKAEEYVVSIQDEVACRKKEAGQSRRGHQRQPSGGTFSPKFILALREFQDRVCVTLGTPVHNPGGGSGSKDQRESGGAGSWLLSRCVCLCLLAAYLSV